MDNSHRHVRVHFLDADKTLLAIDWQDGHTSVYPLPYLRGWCPCATCQGHGGGHVFVPYREDLRLVGLEYTGNYALSMAFNDGHGQGIYPWRRLREWCACEGCGGPLKSTPEEVLALFRHDS